MGTAVAGYVAMAAAAASAVAQDQAARKTAKAQNAAAEWQAAQMSKKNSEQVKSVEDFATDTYNAPVREGNYEQTADAAGQSLASVLNADTSQPTQAAEGNLSKDYLVGRANATASELDRAVKAARLMGRNRALGDLLQKEQLAGMQNASDVAGLGYDMRRIQRSGEARMRDAANAGDKWKEIGGALSGIGAIAGAFGAFSGGGGGGSSSATGNVASAGSSAGTVAADRAMDATRARLAGQRMMSPNSANSAGFMR